jgi:transcriptional regulator with PAS, ATPase and Fis domain
LTVDCGAISPNLVESELFGHARGAFTGADRHRVGAFEAADHGTIFLDEIGEMPLEMQPKLLRVLERREVRRLGSQRTIPVDVRLIAATNRNLAVEVQRGNFREDLYFRLAQAQVKVPPLRDRMEDLTLLVEHFLARTKPRRSVSDIPPQVWAMFQAHRWPGNVRELWNAVQRFSVTPERVLSDDFAGAPGLARDSRPPLMDPAQLEALPVARREASEAFERSYLEALLRRTDGNVMRAAAVAQVSRQMVQKLLRKYNME